MFRRMKLRIFDATTNQRQVFPPTFRDEQETLDALPFIFCRLPTNRYLSEMVHTPVPGEINFVPKTDVPENKNCGKYIVKTITFYRWGIHFAPLSGKRSFRAGPNQSSNVRKTVIFEFC